MQAMNIWPESVALPAAVKLQELSVQELSVARAKEVYVSSEVLEIVELPNGDIVLQRAGDEEPLVNIRFSKLTNQYLPELRMEIAKAMIQAGIEAFSEMAAEVEWNGADQANVKPVVH